MFGIILNRHSLEVLDPCPSLHWCIRHCWRSFAYSGWNSNMESLPILFVSVMRTGVTGAHIRIDENGDSEGNYTVLAVKLSNTSQKIPVSKTSNLFFYCHYQMVPIGLFDNRAVNRRKILFEKRWPYLRFQQPLFRLILGWVSIDHAPFWEREVLSKSNEKDWKMEWKGSESAHFHPAPSISKNSIKRNAEIFHFIEMRRQEPKSIEKRFFFF